MRDKRGIKQKEKELSFPFSRTCSGGGGGGGGGGGKGESNSRERKLQFLSRFPGFWTVGSLLAKKQSCFTLQRLRVDTSFMEFRQLREVGVFSYSVIFGFKSFVNNLECLRP